MRKKETNELTQSRGYFVNDFTRGFNGEFNEGKTMLKAMGLPTDSIPFSIVKLFQNRRIVWKDAQGNNATISFRFKPNQIECYGTYLRRRRSLRVFREWGVHENPDMIARLESEAIGNLCMKCIYENLPPSK